MLISATLIISILIFKRQKRHVLIRRFALFVVFVVVINWLDFFGADLAYLSIPRLLLLASLYIVILVNIFKEFRIREMVNVDFIFGAISAYFILGVLAAFLSVLIEMFFPGSFSFASQSPDFQDHIYFNFVTLTTLGYGDISPLTPQGQMHAVVVALIGQLYLTITIALIVGRYLAHVDR